MTFLPVRGPGRIQRLPILDPDDPNVPQHVRDRYAGRRCVVSYEDYNGTRGDLVAGGPAPPPHHHPPDPALRARFTVTPAHPRVGDTIVLDAKPSSGRIDRYEWLGIPGDVYREGITVTLTATAAGWWAVFLTVTGPDGRHQWGQGVDVAEQ